MKRFLNCKQFAKAQNTVQYVYEIPTGKISVTTLDMETKYCNAQNILIIVKIVQLPILSCSYESSANIHSTFYCKINSLSTQYSIKNNC